MAAPVYQSSQVSGTIGFGDGSISVNKPTSLAVGDLMIAYATVAFAGNAPGLPSGFTAITSSQSSHASTTGFKVADSSDVAASSFSFTHSGFASLSRITGAATNLGAFSATVGNPSNTASPSISGITPKNYGDSVLLMQFWSIDSGNSANVGGYAIVTSNPSWTEGYGSNDGGNSTGMGYATRPEVTATGNFSCTGGGDATNSWDGHIIAIPVPFVSNTNESITMTETKTLSFTITFSDAVSLAESLASTIQKWINAAKNAVSWTNQSKNSATNVQNQSKSSTSWTNQPKS